MSFFSKFFSKKEKQEVLDNGLQTTKTSFFDKLSHAIAGKSKVDDEVLDLGVGLAPDAVEGGG